MAPRDRCFRPGSTPWQAGLPVQQAGFTMVELLIAIVLMLVGIVAVAQLIPAAIDQNFRNRYDSSALILTQSILEQMMAQPLAVGSPGDKAHYFFNTTAPDGTAVTLNLGQNAPAVCGVPLPLGELCSDVGAAVINDALGNVVIDWTQAGTAVPLNYRIVYILAGPTAGQGYQYETRWRVLTVFQPQFGVNVPVRRRILISTRGGPQGLTLAPTTLTTTVSQR